MIWLFNWRLLMSSSRGERTWRAVKILPLYSWIKASFFAKGISERPLSFFFSARVVLMLSAMEMAFETQSASCAARSALALIVSAIVVSDSAISL
jgi:hypothetical protein